MENSEGQVKYCRGTFSGHATPDRAGARPRVQCRVARCDMDLPAHASHPLSRLFACFAGPHIAVARFLNMARRIAQERVPTASNVGSRDVTWVIDGLPDLLQ